MPQFDLSQLTFALFLASVNEAIVEYLLGAPLREHFRFLDTWWLLYVALATGSLLAWFAGANLFSGYIDHVIVSRVLTCILVGGGSSLIHKIANRT